MANDQQHINYLGQDGKVHELLYSDSGGWRHNILSDLAKATGADDANIGLPTAYSPLDGYGTSWNNQQHINYFGQDGKIHELRYSDAAAGKHNVLSDLARATGADDQSSLPNIESLLDGYATPWNNQQHVNYMGRDYKIHELLYTDSGGWQHNTLSDLAKATGADAPNSLPGLAYPYTLDGYTTPWNDQQHVNYVGRDGKVHELWYSDGGGWKHNILNDLAKATGADDQNSLSANADYTLDGYTTPWNDQQHVNYIAQDGKVHELLYTDSRLAAQRSE
jgi:hypothetical protein